MMNMLRSFIGLYSLILLGIFPGQVYAADRPNIVFIAVDDLTYKYLGSFGATHMKTPHIDSLAAAGFLFRNSVVQGTMCGPSRNATITARYPHNFGLYKNGDIKMLPKDMWSFPKALQQNGYYTSWIGKSHVKPYTAGIKGNPGDVKTAGMKAMGFDHVSQSMGRSVALKIAMKRLESGGKWEYGYDSYADYLHDKGLLEQFVKEGKKPTTMKVDDYLDGNIALQSVNWINDYAGDDPFFLWVNFSGPHGPYNPPARYLKVYAAGDMHPAIADPDMSDIPSHLKTRQWTKSAKQMARQRAEHAGMVTFIDEQVGRIISAINESGIRDKTMIVFYSDHGIMEGDHGLDHKQTLYKEVLNGSLIISLPGAKKGQEITEVVELTDIVKTAMALAEVPASEAANAYGHSLMPLMLQRGIYKRTYAFAEQYNAVAIVGLDYKYIDAGEDKILFDLKRDPDELLNVASRMPGIAKRLQGKIDAWRGETGPFIEPTNRNK